MRSSSELDVADVIVQPGHVGVILRRVKRAGHVQESSAPAPVCGGRHGRDLAWGHAIVRPAVDEAECALEDLPLELRAALHHRKRPRR